MTDKRFHLAWFMNFTPDEWRAPFGQGGLPWDGQFYMEMAQTLERACFDYIMIEDKLMGKDLKAVREHGHNQRLKQVERKLV